MPISPPQPKNDEPKDTQSRPQGRVRMLLDVFVFQFKLSLDGIRDLVLIPISLGAALLGLLLGGDEPRRYFDRLLKLGRRSDRFINLFEQHSDDSEPTSDSMLEPLKQRVLEHTHESPVTSRVSEALDQLTETTPPPSATVEASSVGPTKTQRSAC